MNPSPDQANSISRVSQRLNVSYRTTRQLIDSGDLKAYLIRRQWRVLETDLQDYLARHANRQPEVRSGQAV